MLQILRSLVTIGSIDPDAESDTESALCQLSSRHPKRQTAIPVPARCKHFVKNFVHPYCALQHHGSSIHGLANFCALNGCGSPTRQAVGVWLNEQRRPVMCGCWLFVRLCAVGCF